MKIPGGVSFRIDDVRPRINTRLKRGANELRKLHVSARLIQAISGKNCAVFLPEPIAPIETAGLNSLCNAVARSVGSRELQRTRFDVGRMNSHRWSAQRGRNARQTDTAADFKNVGVQ